MSSNDDLFFTTTDLVNKINSVLEREHQNYFPHDGDDALTSDQTQTHVQQESPQPQQHPQQQPQPRFELQRRLPDGSTRKVTEEEEAAANFQSKLKQAAEVVKQLSPPQKVTWAKDHRQKGNQLYCSGKYKEAMDVYLTCLVAMDPSSTNKKDEDEDGKTSSSSSEHESNGDEDVKEISSDDEGDMWTRKIEEEVTLPVLLNLSACALKLKMYKKTTLFCDMASELKCGSGTLHPKVHFRNGRAKMLMGRYDESKKDLETSLSLLVAQRKKEKGGASSSSSLAEEEAVRNELEKLERTIMLAKKNKARQEKAMKIVLGVKDKKGRDYHQQEGSSNMDLDVDNDKGNSTSTRGEDMGMTQSLAVGEGNKYIDDTKDEDDEDEDHGLYKDVTQRRREYSTLRATYIRHSGSSGGYSSSHHRLTHQKQLQRNGMLRWYLKMAERSLRKVLYWLGDEDAMTKSFHDDDDDKSTQGDLSHAHIQKKKN